MTESDPLLINLQYQGILELHGFFQNLSRYKKKFGKFVDLARGYYPSVFMARMNFTAELYTFYVFYVGCHWPLKRALVCQKLVQNQYIPQHYFKYIFSVFVSQTVETRRLQ